MLQQQTKKKQKQNMVVFRDYRKQAVKLVNSQKEKKKKQQKQQDYLHKYVFDYLCSNGHIWNDTLP